MTKTIDQQPKKDEPMADQTTNPPVPKYTFDQVLASSIEYFNGDEMAASTFAQKYALRTNDPVEAPYCELTPDDMHDRIADELYRIERQYPEARDYQDFRRALQGFGKIVPQGSPMYGIGNPFSIVSLSNCVVVASPDDNMSAIIETGKELANLYKRRAGVGLSLDTLRPEGAPVNNAAVASTGAWSFSEYYSSVTRMVGQSGRRGALMLTMDVRHPDVAKFIAIKQDLSRVTGANLSVMLGDEFMKAAMQGDEWMCRWPIQLSQDEIDAHLEIGGEWVEEEAGYNTPVTRRVWRSRIHKPGIYLAKYDAAALWHFLNDCARNTAEPGLLFWDNYGRDLPANYYPEFRSTSTNPCSEIALSPYDSCRLTSLNLKGFVKNPFSQDAYFDYEDFANNVRLAMRIMDNIVELEIECLSKIIDTVTEEDEKILWTKLKLAAVNGRRTGLGTHALGDTLACLGLRYDSDAAIAEVDKIYRTFRDNAYLESACLAEQRGAFPAYKPELEADCPFLERLGAEAKSKMQKYGRRNISLLTNAPTGSVSIVSQTSSGIEPTFRHFYVRRKKVNPNDKNVRVDFKDPSGDSWQHYEMFERNMREYFESHQADREKWEAIYAQSPHRDFGDNLKFWSDELDKILPECFVHAEMIDPLQRVRLQGVLQAYIDHGVSSTINMHEHVTTEEVKAVYEEAWRCGLKGVTVYRDKCRTGVLVTGSSTEAVEEIVEHDAPRRPEQLACDIQRATVEGQKWTVVVGIMGGRPYEVFGGLSENIEIPRKYTEGSVRKRRCEKENAHGRLSCYDLIIGDEDDPFVIKDVVVTFNDDKFGWGTRMLSTMLRHGVPVKYIVEQLRRSRSSSLHSFNKAMARVLSKYISDGPGDEKPDFCKSGNCE
ncbi:MAG: adenosylcobalamin-dependent ribonucleoside-diphosphate reductase [Armatimonadetes bacterium]|nr:adenosylcobalamin-dependent ribonucleoside-diphosphate reductase [Armatimonadota bacterium]